MYRLLLISCFCGFLCAYPISPWTVKLIPQEQQPLIYIIDRPYYDATFLHRSAEMSQPLTSNLVCASVPLRLVSQDFVGALQAAAQGIAGQAQGVAQALGGQFQDVIQSSQGQLADAVAGAPISTSPNAKPKEENRDIPMIKLPLTQPLTDSEPRSLSGGSIKSDEESAKDINVPEPNDKAIPVSGNENADDEGDDD